MNSTRSMSVNKRSVNLQTSAMLTPPIWPRFHREPLAVGWHLENCSPWQQVENNARTREISHRSSNETILLWLKTAELAM